MINKPWTELVVSDKAFQTDTLLRQDILLCPFIAIKQKLLNLLLSQEHKMLYDRV